MNQTQILFAVTLVTFSLGLLGRVWISAIALSDMKHSIEKQSMQLGHLGDLHDSAFNGFRERIDHSTNRFKQQIEDMDRRLEDVESFLTKTTDFVRRR